MQSGGALLTYHTDYFSDIQNKTHVDELILYLLFKPKKKTVASFKRNIFSNFTFTGNNSADSSAFSVF